MVATRCVLSLASCRVIDVPCSGTPDAVLVLPKAGVLLLRRAKACWYLVGTPLGAPKVVDWVWRGLGEIPRAARAWGAREGRDCAGPLRSRQVREPAASHGVREAAHHRDVPRAARESASATYHHTRLDRSGAVSAAGSGVVSEAYR